MSERSGLREFLQGPTGRTLSAVFAVIAALAVGYSIWANIRTDPAIAEADSPLFVDIQTGKTFHQRLTEGMVFPVKVPDAGTMSGYPAELCYWNKDGSAKTVPTAVALNSYQGKDEPTFCPDCGRLVVLHNPVPSSGAQPPPTREEYVARGMNAAADHR